MSRCYNCMKEYNDSYDMCPYCGHEKNAAPKELYFLAEGTIIQERYEIGVSIGNGGFGITYKAWDRTLQKTVAVKEYYPAGLVNRVPGEKRMIIYSGNREKECMNGKIRFLEEARNMAKFNTHPNIVNVYDFFEENNTAYIIMELLEGVTYKEYIKQKDGKVESEEALRVTEAVLFALDEVHKHSILHRDISPDNIFMCSDGKIKLIDFGAARFSSLDDEKTRSVILKPGFAPPEQYQTKSKQGPWTDIYAVGATLYRAITGVLPEESVNRVEEDLLVEPIKLCPDITQNFSNAILRSMALLPELRFQTTKEFLDALHSQTNIRDVRKELQLRKRRRMFSISMISLVILIGVAICMNVLRQRKRSAGVLEPAEVNIWVYADSESAIDEKKQMYEDALAEFSQDYPQIEFNISGYLTAEYEDQLYKALNTGTGPTLFECTLLDNKYYDKCANCEEVLEFVIKDDYYFLKNYDKYYPSKKVMPLSFSVPVIYENTVLNEAGDDIKSLLQKGQVKVRPDNYATYYNLYEDGNINQFDVLPELSSLPDVGDKCKQAEELFLTNQVAGLIGDTSFYGEVEKNMAGYFKVNFLTEAGTVGYFSNCFSIADDASLDEKAAATQILVYLLSDTGQDVINIQNDKGIPFNKNVYKTYIDVNPQYEKLSKAFDKVIFAGENQFNLIRWNEKLSDR